jgi:hypothetical protein
LTNNQRDRKAIAFRSPLPFSTVNPPLEKPVRQTEPSWRWRALAIPYLIQIKEVVSKQNESPQDMVQIRETPTACGVVKE